MFWGILHRTILIDLIKIFSIALVALTGLILLAGLITEAMKNGLGPMQVLAALPLLLPSMLPYTVPATTLFATCIVYGRLAADNEILAVKAAGAHIIHVVWPALILGTAAGGATMLLSMDAIPYSHYLLRTQVVGDAEDFLYAMLRKDGCIRHPKLNFEIDVRNLQGHDMLDMDFQRRGPHGIGYDMTAHARKAILSVDSINKQILLDMRQCDFVQANGTRGFFESHIWPLELPGDFDGCVKARATDMVWCELGVNRRLLEQEKQKVSREIDAHAAVIRQGHAPPTFAEHVRHKINERNVLTGQIRAIDTEVHMRPSWAIGCLCFALVGCPVGIWFGKSDYLSAFITCFLPIVTCYYPLMFCMINLTRAGKLLPCLGMYNANALVLLAGIVMFRRLARN